MVTTNNMWFRKFSKACVKYNFSFELNTYNNTLNMVLRPNYMLDVIIRLKDTSYRKLFKNSIKVMKEYRQ